MSNGYFDIVNKTINTSFSNANNFDLAISTDNITQQILLGNGSNIQAGITLSNNHITLLNQPRYTPAYCVIYPSLTKVYTMPYYEYITFSSAIISDTSFFSVNIDPITGYSNTVTLLKAGTYSVYYQVQPNIGTSMRMGYAANYFHAPVAIDTWNNIPFASSNNGSGMVASKGVGALTDFNTQSVYDVSTFNSNTVLRFLLQCDNATGSTFTLLNYVTAPYNGTSKMIIALVG